VACDDTGGSWSAWRLLGANNRELGRSFRTFPDRTSCADAADHLQVSVDRVEPVVVAGLRSGNWYWELYVDGEAAATSARAFRRPRDSEYNLAHFVTSLHVAARMSQLVVPRQAGASNSIVLDRMDEVLIPNGRSSDR
jgi:hypothetical protein